METIITEKQLKTWVKPTLINMDLEQVTGLIIKKNAMLL